MLRKAACILALLGVLPAAAEAPSTEKAQALLRQMKAACGGDAWDHVGGWHEIGRISLPQHPDARIDYWNDMRSLRYAYLATDGGERVSHEGFDGTTLWSVSPSDEVETTTDEDALKDARLGSYVSAFAYFMPERFPATIRHWGTHEDNGKLYHILRIQPADAPSADLWIDATTNRVARIYTDGGVGTFSGYREFGGVCAPTYIEHTDGATTTVQRLETIETTAVADHVFGPPAI